MTTYPAITTIDLSTYFDPLWRITDLKQGPQSTWHNVAPELQQAFNDAATAGLPLDASNLRGVYWLDPSAPILVRRGTGFIGPDTAPCLLDYVQISDSQGVRVREVLSNPGLTFVVDVKGANKDVPKFALQGQTTVRGLQIAGIGLAEQAETMNVSQYPTITGGPVDHAPVIVTDHKHDDNGVRLAETKANKAGAVTLQCHLVGLMQGVYIGDPYRPGDNIVNTTIPVPADKVEYWSALTSSGQQTGVAQADITITGSTMKRVLGMANVTTGSSGVRIEAIPPYASIISQQASGGLTNFALLKYFQQNGCVLDLWHRAVGLQVDIKARGFRYGVRMRAGAGTGPSNQDTGKYNGARIRMGVERVITLLDVAEDAYLHRVDLLLTGHVMDEYNLNREARPMLDIRSDKLLAGSVDKAAYAPWAPNHAYADHDKVSDGQGNVFVCVVPGTSGSTRPSAAGLSQSAVITDGTVQWKFRNGGFKPFGDDPFARVNISGVINEVSGQAFRNTTADGHLLFDMDGLSVSNWSQAKGHGSDAMINNLSPITVISHLNSQCYASDDAKRVYGVADPTRLHVGANQYFGYADPSSAWQQIGGDPSFSTFFAGKNCVAYPFGGSGGDQDPEDG